LWIALPIIISLLRIIFVTSYLFLWRRNHFCDVIIVPTFRKAVRATVVLLPLFGLHWLLTLYRPQSGKLLDRDVPTSFISWVTAFSSLFKKISQKLKTPETNFINISHARYLYESKLSTFSLITFGLAIFCPPKYWQKKSYIKCWWNWHLVSPTQISLGAAWGSKKGGQI